MWNQHEYCPEFIIVFVTKEFNKSGLGGDVNGL